MNDRNKVLSISNEKVFAKSTILRAVLNALKSIKGNKSGALALSIMLTLSSPTAAFAATVAKGPNCTLECTDIYGINSNIRMFRDITTNHWAYESISKLMGVNAILPTPSANFDPNKLTTRKEFVTMLVKALGLEFSMPTDKFYDVHISDPANKYIAKAVEEGLIFGTSDYNFSPNMEITREQVMAILVRARQKYNIKPTVKSTRVFKDQKDISGWAKDAVAIAVQEGYVAGFPDGTVGPKKTVTNAQTAKMVCGAVEGIKEVAFAQPTNTGLARTKEEELKAQGIVLGPWEYEGTTNVVKEADNVTRRIIDSYTTGITLSVPLKPGETWNDYEWSEWVYWIPNTGINDSGTVEELTEQGLMVIERKTEMYNGEMTDLFRLKTKEISIPGLTTYTYEVRKPLVNIAQIDVETLAIREETNKILAKNNVFSIKKETIN